MNLTKLKNIISGAGSFFAGAVGYHLVDRLLNLKESKEESLAQSVRDSKIDEIGANVENIKEKIIEGVTNLENAYKKKQQDLSANEYEFIQKKLEAGNNGLKEATGLLNKESMSEQIIREAKQNLNLTQNHYNEAYNKISELIEKSKNNLVSLDLSSFYDYLNSLTILQETALFHLLVLIAIIGIVFNIASVFFGNEFIKYFNLETKFPKFAIFFKLRSKYQKYYLILNISLMFILCFGGIFINILIL